MAKRKLSLDLWSSYRHEPRLGVDGFYGVEQRGNYFLGYIEVEDGSKIYCRGRFRTSRAAAWARDAAEYNYFLDGAVLNFPREESAGEELEDEDPVPDLCRPRTLAQAFRDLKGWGVEWD